MDTELTPIIHDCKYEKRFNKDENRITELETEIKFKKEKIDDLKSSMEEIDKKLDKIDHCLNELKLQSERDDFNIDTRVTQLETAQKTLKNIIVIGLSCIGTAVAVLAFLVAIMH